MGELNPARLQAARRRRGLTMTALAKRIGVQQRSISAFEKGEFPPAESTVDAIAKELQFPVRFFFGDDITIPDSDTASFRSLSRMKAGERDAALGAGGLALLLNNWVEERFDLPSCDLPDLSGEDPDAAAEYARSHWGLGYRPIANMVHLLEHKGVRVFSLAEDTSAVDAFSFWHGDTPFVFLNTRKSAERSRFDAAHELGHLLVHRHGAPSGQSAETEANTFASAFLMPASSVWGKIRRSVTLGSLVHQKKNWIVSVAALAYRLHKLGMISDWQYRNLCIQMGEYRISEPEPAPRERSQVMKKIFSALAEDGITKARVAEELAIPLTELEGLIFGLVVTEGNSKPNRSARKGGQLRVVK